MKRAKEVRTVTGRTALEYYKMWFKALKRTAPADSVFESSKFFRTFNNFAEFVKKVHLPQPERFIKYATGKQYPPTMWTSNDVFVQYIEYLDYAVLPLEQASRTVNTLLDEAERLHVDVGDIFDHLDNCELLELLRTRKVSPWFLLNSAKFKQYYSTKITDDQRTMIETIVRPEYWIPKIKKNQEDASKIRAIVKEMDL